MRIMEVLRLRAKGIDFAKREILIREAKGFKYRVTLLPVTLVEPLKAHVARVQNLYEEDLKAGYGRVYAGGAG
ncbi:site-specific integrase [Methylobacillus gramineus]|uniref:hypothetical protein n=1 Tax=Methylobacillus gramineus TaxID=755169 RepID=UPI00299DA9D0|nr:hypothetical protein [Methylobacillus gramineus]